MRLPVHRIIWAATRADHHDHLHVEGSPLGRGTPPADHPGITPSLKVILSHLDAAFPEWPSLGIYNRRPIRAGGVDRPDLGWSQHAYANAVDIGSLFGVAAQRPYYKFLTREDHGNMKYRGVENVPTLAGEILPFAKDVIDWGIEEGLIIVTDDNPDDWDRPMTDGRYWTFEYRRRNSA